MSEQHALKRRGLIAGAAALVAGMAAKQAAQPVGATNTDTNFVASGGTGTAYGNFPGYQFGVNVSGIGSGVTGASHDGHGVDGLSDNSVGVSGSSFFGRGVAAFSSRDHALVATLNGIAGTQAGKAAVLGLGMGSSTFGVVGDARSGDTETGAVGTGGQGAQWGVWGRVNNAPSTIAVYGLNTSSGAGGIGVRGDCLNGIGVYGSTNAAGQYGVIGQTLVDNAFGLAGIANTNNSAAFAGGTSNPTAFAASFQGHVQVDGVFDVIGAGNKHAVVPHPDGSHRTIYSIEAPECWLEDFGEGTLTAGKAEIKLDADFATLVHTETFHVFVTPHVEQHVHVSQRTASGFVVEASAALAKAAGLSASGSGTFSWRVVAKPKTEANVERLAKARLAPQIDFTKLPGPTTPPPVVIAPTKTPPPPTGPSTAPVPRTGTTPAVQPAASAPASAPPTSGQPPAANPPSTGNAPSPLPAPRT